MRFLPPLLLFNLWPFVGFAETWPTLEEYVGECVLIVKAEHVGEIAEERHKQEFRVLETWLGVFDPKDFLALSSDGNLTAFQGTHGVRITEKGQEIIFFFTRHNQPPNGIRSHSTAFPIKDGKIIYGSTNNHLRKEFSELEFKNEILKLKSSKSPTAEHAVGLKGLQP